MPIKPVHNITVSEAITEKLETMIVEGIFKPGNALPPERQLARNFAVSRASLRQALSVLEARGLILSRQGGGNYVCDVAKKSFADPLLDLMKRHHELKFQIIELRQTLECSAAYFAAKRATEEDREIIRQRLDDLMQTLVNGNSGEQAKADLELHLSIADAAHNAPLSLMIRNIYSLLLNEVEENLNMVQHDDINSLKLHAQHQQMAQHVIDGNAEDARRVVNEHLELIRETFIKNGVIAKRTEVAEVRAYLANLQPAAK